jgi:PAS domain S-box-containing protein
MLDRLYSLNTRLKLSESVSLLLALLVLLAMVNIAVIYDSHQDAERLGNSVNIAGQQRMLSQRMVRFANEIAHGEDPQQARERLRVAIERYDRNLKALEDGGRVFDTELNPGASSTGVPSVTLRGERLEPAPPAASDELRAERAEWEAYEPHIRTVLTADRDDPAFDRSLAYVRTNSDSLLSVSDSVTAEFARVVRVRRAALRQALVVLLGVDVLVALLGVLFAHRFLGRPMARIARRGRELADGKATPRVDDLPMPIDPDVPAEKQRAELAQLSRSFSEVQQYLRTASAQAQSLARREFDAPVLDEPVPGELGASLETMRADLQSYIRELRETTEELDAVIEASPDAIFVTDTQGRVQRWNPAAEELFGWSESEVLGEPNPSVPAERRDEYRDDLYRVVSGESLAGVERRRRTRSGKEIDVSISTATMSGPDGEIVGVMSVVEDITSRKARERTLRRQRDELQMLNRVNDVILEVSQELLAFSDRERIEELVCERLAGSDLYELAWIGDLAGETGDVSQLTVAGVDDDRLATITTEQERDEAVRRALEAGAIQVVEIDGPDRDDTADGQTTDVSAFAVVPLTDRNTVHGVLAVYTGREMAFRQRERSGLSTLGRTIGFAMNALANRKLLFADTVVDVTFEVSESDAPLVQTTTALDCQVSLDGFVAGTDSETLDLYLNVSGTSAAAFVDQVCTEPDVVDATVVADEQSHRRVEVTLSDEATARLSTQQGAVLHAIELDGSCGTYVLEAPLSADVAAIVEAVRAAHPGVEFVAKHERERPVSTAAELATAVQDRLTDRQYEVYKTAYLGGYFEWPRDRTIEELADGLGIAGSTFHHHLRHAQRKVARALFDRSEPVDS